MDKARVLLAQEDSVVAMDLASELEASGMVVSGTTGTLAGALKLIEEKSLDIALLDIGLQDGDSLPAARRLRALNIPFVFLTSFSKAEIDPEFRDVPCLWKPQASPDIAKFVADLVRSRSRRPDRRERRDDRALS